MLERAVAGELDESGLKSAIFAVGHSLQTEHHLLRGLSQDAIFNYFFDAAADYLGACHVILNLLDPEKPALDPKQIRAHTMAVAARQGEFEVVQSLLSQGADPNDLSIYFGFALSAAAKHGHPSIVKVLLDNCAEPQTCDRRFRQDYEFSYSRSPIVLAAGAGHENIIRILMEPKYKHPASGDAYNYAIKKSIEGRHVASAFLLLNCGIFDQPSSIHQGVLLSASANGCLPLVKAMIENGVDVNGSDEDMSSPLELATRRGHEDVVSFLLLNGAKQITSARMWDDAITTAARNGDVGILKILLQHGADINSRLGHHATTPLYQAVRSNRADTVRFLLKKGAALEVMEGDMTYHVGSEALEQAVRYGYTEMVHLLAAAGVDVKSVAPKYAKNVPPPLILAKMWSHDDIVKVLVEHGAEDVDPLETEWADTFRKGGYPKSSWTLRSQCTG